MGDTVAQRVRSGEYKTIHRLINALLDLPPAPYIPLEAKDFKPQEGYAVDMDSGAITCADSARPILGTTGVASCMAVAIYNPRTREGGLVHLNTESGNPYLLSAASRKSLAALLKAVRSNDTETLEVRIAGPRLGMVSPPFVGEVVQMLNERPNIEFLSFDVDDKPFANEIGIDTRRWDEGWVKGDKSVWLTPGEVNPEGAQRRGFLAGMRHIVDVSALPSCPSYDDNGLFDARGLNMPPPRKPTGARGLG